MSAFLAIVQDTWRQSKHQWVMLLLIGALVIIVPAVVLVPELRTAPDGSKFLGTVFQSEKARFGWEAQWNGVYAETLRAELGYDDDIETRQREVHKLLDQLEDVDFDIDALQATDAESPELARLIERRRELEHQVDASNSELRDLRLYVMDEVRRITGERTASIDKLQKGVEYWMAEVVQYLFTISLMIYLFVCAGYIPNMIESGSIDLVLSKPIRRWHIYFGKYLGGLLLYSALLIAAYVLIFLGMGLRTGFWHWRFFGGLPMTLFSAALLFAIIGWVGLWTRSTLMAAILGLVYYVIVDSAIGYLGDLGGTPMLADVEFIQTMADITKAIFPSFVWLKQSAVATGLSVFIFPWHQVIVGVIWLVICLGTAYNRFRINDY